MTATYLYHLSIVKMNSSRSSHRRVPPQHAMISDHPAYVGGSTASTECTENAVAFELNHESVMQKKSNGTGENLAVFFFIKLVER